MANLISETKLDINQNTQNVIERYSFLKGQPFAIPISTDDDNYMLKIYFNFANEYPYIQIETSSGELVQGDTYMAEYPTNLLVADDFIDYGLFFYPYESVMRLYKLDNKSCQWYNNNDKTYTEWLEMLQNGEVY